MSWNTRPKFNYSEQAAQPAAHWRQASPNSTAAAPAGPYDKQADQQELDESMAYLQQYITRPPGHPNPQAQPYGHSPAGPSFHQQSSPWDRTPSHMQPSPGDSWRRGAAAAPTGISGFSSTPASRLVQPKGNPNLQQWIASREGSQQNNQQPYQERSASQQLQHHDNGNTFDPVTIHHAPPPPPMSAPAGALVEPPPQQVGGPRRALTSPNTVVQQTIAAQQLAMHAAHSQHAPHQQTPFQGWGDQSPAPPSTAPPPQAFAAAHSPVRQPLFRAGDHDGNLVLIATYLKNHYGRESEEASRGIETMAPEDVLGLVQCFYIDAYRLIRTLRDQSSVGRGTFTTTDPNTSAIVPIVDSAEKKARIQHQLQNPAGAHHRTSPSPQPQGQVLQQPNDSFPVFNGAPPINTTQPPQVLAVSTTHEQQVFVQQQYHQRTTSEMHRSASQQPSVAPSQPQPYAAVQPQQAQPIMQTQQQPIFEQPQQQAQQQPLVSSTGSASGKANGQQQYHPHHARGPSNHRRELSLEQQLRDIPRRVGVASVPLKSGMMHLRAGAMMLKYCRKGPPHMRYFSVQDRTTMHKAQETVLPHLTWAVSINGKSAGQLSLLTLDEVLVGPVGPNAQRFTKNNINVVVDDNKKPVDENMCFTLIFAERTLELCALTEEEYTTFVGTLQSVVARNREMRATQLIS
ncbi:Hypothetical protein, putative [Bodo saltans]|uniref:PH domain-containing protein n=1 Tax=Bodo saltans TaxID=75058 RepID=A0A0S4IWA5_BODSA|nr:Hypothetical protein, putative [Bodo saltans]|eukprot:CUF69571.1 Hypothetical protein, putative [Bodo saltans]